MGFTGTGSFNEFEIVDFANCACAYIDKVDILQPLNVGDRAGYISIGGQVAGIRCCGGSNKCTGRTVQMYFDSISGRGTSKSYECRFLTF